MKRQHSLLNITLMVSMVLGLGCADEMDPAEPVQAGGMGGSAGAGGEAGTGGQGGAAGVGGVGGSAGTGGVAGEGGTGGSGGAGGEGGFGGAGGSGGIGGTGGVAGMGGEAGTGGAGGAPQSEIAPNELIISELMYDPHGGLEDDHAEWIEIYNASDHALDLNGCVVVDEAGLDPLQGQADLAGLTVPAGDVLLLGRTQDVALNGGLTFDALFGFGMSNGGDNIILMCGEDEIDRVEYDDGDRYPDARQASIARGGDDLNSSNTAATRWCLGEAVYLEDPPHRGTPGEVNPPCPILMNGACQSQADCGPGTACIDDVCVEVEEPECRRDEECDQGMICQGEMCVMAPMVIPGMPEAGELIVTEMLSDPHNGLEDDDAEWIELMNASQRELNLDGCDVIDEGIAEGGRSLPLALDGYTINPGDLLLFARSSNLALNGGLMVNGTFGFGLSNGGDSVILRCGGVAIDTVRYGGNSNIPRAQSESYSRSADDLMGPNGPETRWCPGSNLYLNEPEHRGTPGEANPVCP